MTCVLHECPVLAGQCDADGECYIWRCENPHAPAPERNDDSLASLAELMLKIIASRRIA